MIDLAKMTPAEAQAEADRRRRARAAGRPIADDGLRVVEPAPVDNALEAREQRRVIDLFRAMGCRVYETSQKRAAKVTPGIPDLWVVCIRAGLAWFWETKRSAGGRHSSVQLDFAEECALTGTPYGTGDRRAAEEYLIGLQLAERMPDGSLEPVRYTLAGAVA